MSAIQGAVGSGWTRRSLQCDISRGTSPNADLASVGQSACKWGKILSLGDRGLERSMGCSLGYLSSGSDEPVISPT